MWKLNITKLDNGYTLVGADEKEVIEIEESDKGEKEAMTKLLRRIAEYFGIMNDGFSKENLNVRWNKKGDEVE